MGDPAAQPPRPDPLTVAAAAVETCSLPLMEMTMAALSASGELSALQLRVLLAVDRRDPVNLATLAAVLEVSRPSASRLVDRLVEAGLLTRTVAAGNRREVRLGVTTKGRRALTRLRRGREAAIAAILKNLSEPQRDALVDGLTAFARAAEGTPRP